MLAGRAAALIRALGQPVVDDPRAGLSAGEVAGCIARTLALPEVAELRPTLVPEFPVYASEASDDAERITTGFADAVGFGADGTPEAIVDWKSDVDPRTAASERYRAQIRSYLQATGAERGLLVFVTHGTVLEVS